MRDARRTALRHAARAAERHDANVLAYSNGSEVVLVVHGRVAATRTFGSAGIARAVVDRVLVLLEQYQDRRPDQVLDAAGVYAEAAWRNACRRRGRRVA